MKLDKPCKLWPSVNSRGYSTVRINGITKQRHRVAWEKEYGPIPYGLLVCHHCDVKNCYEVTHLFLGTQKDNVKDYNNKGLRTPARGLNNGGWIQAKLTIEEAKEIINLYRNGTMQKEIAQWYGVSQATVSRIVHGKRYGVQND